MKRSVRQMGITAGLLLLGGLALTYPDATASGASRGLAVCGSVIIPSLLPILVLAETGMRCGVSGAVGRWLARPVGWLFRLPGVCATAIVLSAIGGYPAGAAAVAQLLESRQITEQQAERMLHFCVNAGPAFAVSTVGVLLLGDGRVGMILLLACLLASLLIGIGEALFASRTQTGKTYPYTAKPLSYAFTEAVNTSTRALLYMCGFVILFSVLQSLADVVGLTDLAAKLCGHAAILPGMLEVSNGMVVLAGEQERSMLLCGFLLGFGGLSVQCQIRARFCDHPAALRRFSLFRLLHGVLSGWISVLLLRVIPLPLTTLATGTARVQVFTATPAASMAMVCMCGCFLLSSEKKIAKCR